MRLTILWFRYLLRALLGRRRFLGFTPPSMSHQRIYDRVKHAWLHLAIRDIDDWIQVEHIFLNEEFELSGAMRNAQIARFYNRLLADGQRPLIVDLGANIGLASRYFHQLYPEANIVAVEPNKSNCAMARQNLPATATLLEAAISSQAGSAGLVDTGRNCGFQVDRDKGHDIRLVTVADILDGAGDVAPFLIKIDIEGFEEDLFSRNIEWIDRFPILLIELHDWMEPKRRFSRHFLSAMAARDRELMHFAGYVVSISSHI